MYQCIPYTTPLLLPACDPMRLTVVLSHPSTRSVTVGQASKRPHPLEEVDELSPRPGCACSLLSAAVGVMYCIRPLAQDSAMSLVWPRSGKQVRCRYPRWDVRLSLCRDRFWNLEERWRRIILSEWNLPQTLQVWGWWTTWRQYLGPYSGKGVFFNKCFLAPKLIYKLLNTPDYQFNLLTLVKNRCHPIHNTLCIIFGSLSLLQPNFLS